MQMQVNKFFVLFDAFTKLVAKKKGKLHEKVIHKLINHKNLERRERKNVYKL